MPQKTQRLSCDSGDAKDEKKLSPPKDWIIEDEEDDIDPEDKFHNSVNKQPQSIEMCSNVMDITDPDELDTNELKINEV